MKNTSFTVLMIVLSVLAQGCGKKAKSVAAEDAKIEGKVVLKDIRFGQKLTLIENGSNALSLLKQALSDRDTDMVNFLRTSLYARGIKKAEIDGVIHAEISVQSQLGQNLFEKYINEKMKQASDAVADRNEKINEARKEIEALDEKITASTVETEKQAIEASKIVKKDEIAKLQNSKDKYNHLYEAVKDYKEEIMTNAVSECPADEIIDRKDYLATIILQTSETALEMSKGAAARSTKIDENKPDMLSPALLSSSSDLKLTSEMLEDIEFTAIDVVYKKADGSIGSLKVDLDVLGQPVQVIN